MDNEVWRIVYWTLLAGGIGYVLGMPKVSIYPRRSRLQEGLYFVWSIAVLVAMVWGYS